jgi:hypothetical protein
MQMSQFMSNSATALAALARWEVYKEATYPTRSCSVSRESHLHYPTCTPPSTYELLIQHMHFYFTLISCRVFPNFASRFVHGPPLLSCVMYGYASYTGGIARRVGPLPSGHTRTRYLLPLSLF